jgi:zinc-ribbon domain
VAPAATGPAATRPLDLPDAGAAARPATPNGDGATRPEQPAAQRPTTARPPSVSIQRRPPTRRLEPGDLVCPECGEGNPTTRKFCSRCGTSLETAQVVKAKWWQKLLPRRGPKKRQAGDRPSARRTRKSFPSKVMAVLFGGVSRVVGVIFLIGGLVYGIVPNVRDAVNEEVGGVKGKINSWIHPTRTEVIPTAVLGSSQLPGHAAQFLTDGPTNTYWESRLPRLNTRKLTLDFTFQNKFDLKNIAIWNGVGSSKEPDYTTTQRLQTIFLNFPDTAIKGCEVPVKDIPKEAVKIDVSDCNADGITRIRVTILEYAGDAKLKTVAVAKVQFYKKG